MALLAELGKERADQREVGNCRFEISKGVLAATGCRRPGAGSYVRSRNYRMDELRHGWSGWQVPDAAPIVSAVQGGTRQPPARKPSHE